MTRTLRGGWLGVVFLALVAPLPARAVDAWDAVYLGGQKIGHTHIRVEPVTDARGRKLFRIQVNTVGEFQRGDDRVTMEVRYGTIETVEGSVLRLDTRTSVGRDELRTHGDVVDGTMNLIFEGGGARQQQPIPWGPEVRGPYAAELSLSREPLEPGQSRELKMFIPSLNQICTTKLAATEQEPVPLGGGETRSLVRVEQSVEDAQGKAMPELDTVFWVDGTGQILKSRTAFLGGMETYRTTKTAALATNGDFDLRAATILRTERRLPNSTQTRSVVYRLTYTGENLSDVFPDDQRQTLRKGTDGRGGTLTVATDSPATAATAASPGPEFLSPNPLINSDDSRVIAHAKAAVGSQTDPWQQAVAIQNWVFQNLKKKNFGTAFASAKEVAKDLEGDCSEHGVLVAAMCRARGIPSRVVVGLVYADELGGFGPHLWNEVYVNGRWVAIDAAFNQSEVDATHLKLSDSSLDGVAPFEAFLPVTRVFNQLKVEPTEIR